ncbi:carboxypeptidase-like regulatory domain-containing protein [Caloranaerobacter ferrireducens]|uniref:carboxypeptidase-like regulatory domain-containing protein n=1 Tax=Caloranaerobacter ferrireducens TaxID=1323370 RepID=UPI00084DE8B7|nr:carboxypeptidase-like regulatory domain-containing protein [Caloranaerobacter ferrireducens]
MAEFKELYKLGQSETRSLTNLGEEIRIDLQLEDNILVEVGTVFGKVVDGNGTPIEGATVKITDTKYNPLYHAITDINGDYTINNVTPGEQYLIFATKDNYNLNQGISFTIQTGQQIERNFTLTPVSSTNNSLIAGDITDEQGQPLQGAIVRLIDNTDPENPQILKTTYTNEYGQFIFFDLAQGIYNVSASKLGYTSVDINVVIDQPNQVRNVIISMPIDPVTRKGTINGIIKDKDGVPIEGAFVILFRVDIDENGKEILVPIRVTKTNDEGLYLFEQVEQGNYKIKASKQAPEISA